MKLLMAAVALVLTAFILWGIGAFVRRKICAQKGTWSVSIALGLATTVFLGGILNLLHVAYGPVLWGVAVSGFILAVLEMKHVSFRRMGCQIPRLEFVAAALVIAAVIAFTIVTQLPPSAFNCHDDLQKYFTYSVRMLATGTLFGSPLDGSGYQTLGATSFLQGFVLSVLPIGYINAVDAVFGLFALMLLTASAGWRRYRRFPGALLGPVLVIAINPLYVNVSALYLGGLLMAASVMLLADAREPNPPAPLVLGLLYAALVALKPTFVLFCVFHTTFAALAVNRSVGCWKTALLWIGRVGTWAVVAIAPWFVTHLPNYLAKSTLGDVIVPDETNGFSVMSYVARFFGGGFTRYSMVTGLALLVGIFAVVVVQAAGRKYKGQVAENFLTALHLRSHTLGQAKKRVAWGVFAAAATCGLSYPVGVLFLGKQVGYSSGLRYTIPTILGCAVPVIAMSPRLPRGIFIRAPIVACVVVVLAVFAPSAVHRYRQALKSGNILAFSYLAEHPLYLRYNQFCLSKAAAEQVRQFQERIPVGEPLLAWINTPFLLDYRRNTIVVAEESGLVSPWAHIPDNVRYILMQRRGHLDMGSRDIAYYQRQDVFEGTEGLRVQTMCLTFLQNLNGLIDEAEVVATDGELILVRIRSPGR